jgi:hypothetical protein
LTASPDGIAVAEMMKAYSGLDQALITELQRRIGGRAPEVFPYFMGVVKPPLIEKVEALTQKV